MLKYLCVALLCMPAILMAQVSQDYAVQLTAVVEATPPSITILWETDPNAIDYTIYRKSTTATSWGTALAILDNAAIGYTDVDVVPDSLYEYRILRHSTTGVFADGYILSGIAMHATDYRGTCLILNDTSATSGSEALIQQYMFDLAGDGWYPVKIDVDAGLPVESIRNMITVVYLENTDLEAIFLLGHVPVPYSGNLNPDGHPDHLGAWPADGIYGDLDGFYTDYSIDNATASRPENWNVPGDGKYDQVTFPGSIEFQVGRVDMHNMPSFALDEHALLAQYLTNDHAYRTGLWKPESRALVDDNFGAFGGEAFASSGYRNFAPLTGPANTQSLDFISTMQTDSYLWAYGCGGGWFQGAGGIGSTTDMAADTLHTVFTMLFGSYFGDWDSQDNFLRSPLAAGRALTCAWSGRPYWYFHYMGMGATTGACARMTMNNTLLYLANIYTHKVHIALMGDPTLRMFPIAPISDLVLSIPLGTTNLIHLDWVSSPDPVDGYYVYRANSLFGKYERLTPDFIETNTYEDISPLEGRNYYMVKPVRLETTFSGSFYNTGIGIIDSADITLTNIENSHTGTCVISPNPAGNVLYVSMQGNAESLGIIENLQGQCLLQICVYPGSQAVDITSLPGGFYFLHIAGQAIPFIKN